VISGAIFLILSHSNGTWTIVSFVVAFQHLKIKYQLRILFYYFNISLEVYSVKMLNLLKFLSCSLLIWLGFCQKIFFLLQLPDVLVLTIHLGLSTIMTTVTIQSGWGKFAPYYLTTKPEVV